MAQTNNRIVKAPGLLLLLARFGLREDCTFTCTGPDFGPEPQEVSILLNHLSHEDGSGTSFNFGGYITEGDRHPDRFRVRGYFRVTNGQGWIEFVK